MAVDGPAVPVRPTRVQAASGDVGLVTPAKRRGQVIAQHREMGKRARLDREAAAAAERVFFMGTEDAFTEGLPACDTLPPLALHGSHAFLVVGGYVGCIRCGGVAGFTRSTMLSGPCRGHCPAGSRGPIRLLAQGKLPRRKRQHDGTVTGDAWPSGEAFPVVRVYAPSSASSSNPPPAAPAQEEVVYPDGVT